MSSHDELDFSKRQNVNYILLLWFIHLHSLGVYGLWLLIFEAKWMTVLFVTFITTISYIGVTVGAHRYFAHRTFEAETIVKLFFLLGHTLAGVGPLYNWVLYHRMHHKYYKTNKDPYQSSKGFFYSFFKNDLLQSTVSEETLEKEIDMRDFGEESSVYLEKKLYWIWFVVLTIFIPIYIPIIYWDESIQNSIFIVGLLRLAVTSNISKLVDRAILVWGLQPEDRFPIDDNSMFFLNKTYWLNYHYLLPWDWKSTEFGKYNKGLSIILIKALYDLGLVRLTKTISSEAIREAVIKVANKEWSWENAEIQLKQHSKDSAIKDFLRFHH
ncbi:hypothetical protein M0802_005617 [Mischocyttarus mexicanus]|nr:hypothetical protein M0802_005617 [Mischocyttarus mexicanus]